MDRIASKMAWCATAVALFLVCLAGCETNDVLDPQGTDDGPDPQVTCETLSGAITEDTTLSHPCYEVTGTVEVIDGATLTIDAGVTLKFAEEVQMTVSSGSLVAVGTADEPITFTGMESTRGYWGGLRFTNSNSTSNALRYVTIEYGGGYWDANLIVTSGATGVCKVAVSDCTLRESGTYGFLIEGYDTTVTTFANNTITGNAMGAGKIAAKLVGDLDDSSTYTGNDEDIVWIFEGTVETDQTWPAIDVPYYVDTSTGLYIEADLTISPGATLEFADTNERLYVAYTGSLYAVGTAANPITLTGATLTAGSWGGVRYDGTQSASNRLEYVEILYGGGYYFGNLDLAASSQHQLEITVGDCTFSHSSKWGVSIVQQYVTVTGDIAADNTFSDNAIGDVEYR